MRRYIRLATWMFFLSLACGALPGCGEKNESKPEKMLKLKSREEKIAYSIGLKIGSDLRKEDLDLNAELLLQGLKSGFERSPPLLTDDEIEEVRRKFVEERRAALEKKRNELAEKNRKAGEDFLEKNAGKDGITALPSGLQYRIIEPGTGAPPNLDDNVKVHYTAMFIDGTEFENTRKSGRPAVFPLRGVIPGWTEALQLMKEGARWKLFVPAHLAYGEKGAGDRVEPGQTLVFDIEFLALH